MSLSPFESAFFSIGNRNLVLRQVAKSDRSALVDFAIANENSLRGPFPATISALTGRRSESNAWLLTRISNFKEKRGIFCVIQDLDSNKIVGFVSAFQFEWRTPKCEISWMVIPELQRQGIAEKCCRQMIQYLFRTQKLNKILCRVSPENKPSIQLAEKLGFQKEGLHARDFRDGYDRLLDVVYFGLLA